MTKRILWMNIWLLILTGLSGLLTFKVISWQSTTKTLAQSDPIITLHLPNQTYVLTRESLESQEEIIIPVNNGITPKINYNSQTGEVELSSYPQDYVIETSVIREEVAMCEEEAEIILTPSYTLRPRYTSLIAEYNLRLNRIYRSPLKIRLKNGIDYSELTLAPSILRTILLPQVVDLNRALEINAVQLNGYIEARLTPKQKEYFNAEATYKNARTAINARFWENQLPW
ncbi:MAG: hypothetical protein V1487_01025 [bacterium]